MTPLFQVPFDYRSLGPWMCAVEMNKGGTSVALVYSLDDVVHRLMPYCAEDAGAVRLVCVDARGQMIFGMERRTAEWVGIREVFDVALSFVDADNIEGSIAVMSMSETIRMSAQRRGLA
jgi:hypothetical protein